MKGIVLSLIAVIAFLCVVVPAAGQSCGPYKSCPGHECCSWFGWCGITEAYCSAKLGCQSYCWISDENKLDVARHKDIDAERNNWNLTKAHVTCQYVDGSKPYEWRKKFNWTAFGDLSYCGQCVRVVNTRKNEGEYVYATLRIVDSVGEGFQIDTPAFKPLDFDNREPIYGHINVSYHFINCEDDGTDEKALFSIV